MLVLDTDHVSVLGSPSELGNKLLVRLHDDGRPVATSIITVEEQLRGWLAEINRTSDPYRQVLAYDHFQSRIEFFAAWTVLGWDSDSAARFVVLRREGVRIGTMDLKIACICLGHRPTLLTRNQSDFALVPGLTFENWLS